MTPGLAALLALAAALAATVTLEVGSGAGSSPPSIGTPPAWQARASATPDGCVLVDARRIVLARPLFTPGRRPSRVATNGRELPRLSGIVRGPSVSLAIFQAHRDGGRSTTLTIGGELAGWRVARIDAAGVMLTRGRARLLLLPRYAAMPPPSPPVISIASIAMLSRKHTNPQLAW